MKPVNFSLILLSIIIILFSCSSKLSEQEYYTKAQQSYSEKNFKEAIDLFQKLIKYYPETKQSADALFMIGYIYANELNDLKNGEKYYKEFIAKYPDHDLADDAQYEIKTLGKDINELPIFQNIAADSISN